MSAQAFDPSIPRLRREFFDRSVHQVAPDLIGVTLLVDGVGGLIVEGEGYHHGDTAGHRVRGRTAATPAIVRGPRIGITRATELSWRYCLEGSPYLSRPLRP